MSATDLARAVNVSRTSFYKWLNGISLPRPEAIYALAEALHVSPEYLQTGVPFAPDDPLGEEADVRSILVNAEQLLSRITGISAARIRLSFELDAPSDLHDNDAVMSNVIAMQGGSARTGMDADARAVPAFPK